MSFGKTMNKYNLQFFTATSPDELKNLLNSLPFEYDLLSITGSGMSHIAWIHAVRDIKKVPLREPVEAPIQEEGLRTEKSSTRKNNKKINTKRKA